MVLYCICHVYYLSFVQFPCFYSHFVCLLASLVQQLQYSIMDPVRARLSRTQGDSAHSQISCGRASIATHTQQVNNEDY